MAQDSDAGNVRPAPAEEQPAAKRIKIDDPAGSPAPDAQPGLPVPGDAPSAADPPASKQNGGAANGDAGEAPKPDNRRAGLAPVKKEFLIEVTAPPAPAIDDDAAEGRTEQADGGNQDDRGSGKQGKARKKQKGQNTERSFGRFDDAIRLCHTRAYYPEFSPKECRFGDKCRMLHDLRKYLDEGRRNDVDTFGGKCPVFETYGKCPSGWKCRFVRSHMEEVERDDGRKELVLIDKTSKAESGEEGAANGSAAESKDGEPDDQRPGVRNIVDVSIKYDLGRKRTDFSRADEYINWLNKEARLTDSWSQRRKDDTDEQARQDLRAQFVDPPFKPSEKRRLYFGPETPVLAPLTTQGNLPFRRLCVELGAQLTYSEMAMGLPLMQGTKADWTLMKAHDSELEPPRVDPGKVPVLDGYDNGRDLRFGAQISAGQPWVAVKAADALSRFCPHLRLIDLNCGCPIDMVYKAGGGSALLESHGKMERMIRGMNAVSGEVPITAKIRTGVRQNRPTAAQVIGKLAFGGREHRDRLGAPGCAAVTLHGRSREQRYTKRADWGFIAESAALVKTYNDQRARLADTAAEPDPSTLPNSPGGRMYFIGNGDCYSHVEYQDHIDRARVDSVMIGRGALIKPWLFEEIEKGQYLDKSASERLGYIEKFVRYGLEAWGSDELGIGFTRRFLLEWLSFSHRYLPIGLLEHLPPSLNDRPPAYRGRNDLETLLASESYMDWIKISEMFLGPVHPGFKFQPKHKSNAYEAEG